MQCEEKINFINGNDIEITFTIYKLGNLVSLDGATIRFLMAYHGSNDLLLEKEGIQTDNTGEFIVALTPKDTNGYTGIFDYQIEITDAATKVHTTDTKQLIIKNKIC